MTLLRRLLDLLAPPTDAVPLALLDTARALYPSDEARTLAELERLIALAYSGAEVWA